MGGTGVTPVKFGVTPDFVFDFDELSVNANQKLSMSSNGFGRDAQNDRPEACATQNMSFTSDIG
jgi:hypothetical protein